MSDAEKPTPAPPQGLVYPCEYPIKIFVKPESAAEDRLLALVRSLLAGDAVLKSGRRPSSNGKYLSITVDFVAESEAHLMKIIKAIMADPAVVLAL